MEVKWDVMDSFGNLKEEYYDGVCLMKGTKKDCGLFVDSLKVNREQAEINNKEGRTRKKPTKLLDYAADPVEEVNSSPAKITQRVLIRRESMASVVYVNPKQCRSQISSSLSFFIVVDRPIQRSTSGILSLYLCNSK